MPTYQYRCKECSHDFEIVQAFTDDALTSCPECQGALKKVYGNVGISFKGSGFYKNDARSGSSSKASASSTNDSSNGSSDSSSDSSSTSSSDSSSTSSSESSSSNGSSDSKATAGAAASTD